jgi:hypothetical protein
MNCASGFGFAIVSRIIARNGKVEDEGAMQKCSYVEMTGLRG